MILWVSTMLGRTLAFYHIYSSQCYAIVTKKLLISMVYPNYNLRLVSRKSIWTFLVGHQSLVVFCKCRLRDTAS